MPKSERSCKCHQCNGMGYCTVCVHSASEHALPAIPDLKPAEPPPEVPHTRAAGCVCTWEEGDSPCPVHDEVPLALRVSSRVCNGCGKPLLQENAWMTDGCPCNSQAGVNELPAPDGSAELAEIEAGIRRWIEMPHRTYSAYEVKALLRMVDELREHSRLDQADMTAATEASIAERDELRAKLAEAEKENRRRETVGAMLLKRAEASEARAEAFARDLDKEYAAHGATELRVKELEMLLLATRNDHT